VCVDHVLYDQSLEQLINGVIMVQVESSSADRLLKIVSLLTTLKSDLCPECGRESERYRGISQSKYCGYHRY